MREGLGFTTYVVENVTRETTRLDASRTILSLRGYPSVWSI